VVAVTAAGRSRRPDVSTAGGDGVWRKVLDSRRQFTKIIMTRVRSFLYQN